MPVTARKSAANKFIEQIRRSNALHLEYLDDANALSYYARLTAWQHDYLLPFFSDLSVHAGYEEAIEFVVSDLSGTSIASRDRDIERAAPLFIRLLPTRALQTLATGAEMNARVLGINLAICRQLARNGRFPDVITEDVYLPALREVATLNECIGIIRVLGELGEHLDTLVRIPLIGGTLRAMRGPAHAMGYGALHGFLESGFTTFRAIPDVPVFLDLVLGRSTEIFERAFSAKSPR
ncbi:MAG: hypothetical protein QNJ11_07785 [Woeseiaceae bacterium]|nr:hypothetical protein [Woeseiaceae bacterium]